MRSIKIKMFGKKSVSSILFWVVILCLALIIFNGLQFGPELVKNKDIPILPNISPLLGQLTLLVPLALIFYSFQRKVLFTKEIIKYLYVFVLCNFFAILLSFYVAVSFFNMGAFEAFFHVSSSILLIIFALFIAAIFKQGFQIQQENNLTI